jgi:hypothetical protein
VFVAADAERVARFLVGVTSSDAGVHPVIAAYATVARTARYRTTTMRMDCASSRRSERELVGHSTTIEAHAGAARSC